MMTGAKWSQTAFPINQIPLGGLSAPPKYPYVFKSLLKSKPSSSKIRLPDSSPASARPASAGAWVCGDVRHRKRGVGVAKPPREISSDQPRCQNSYFFGKEQNPRNIVSGGFVSTLFWSFIQSNPQPNFCARFFFHDITVVRFIRFKFCYMVI